MRSLQEHKSCVCEGPPTHPQNQVNSTTPLNIIITQKPIAIKLLPAVDESHIPKGHALFLMNSVEERADCCERMAGDGDGLSVECIDEDLPGFFFGALGGGGGGFVSLGSYPVYGGLRRG